MKFLKLLSPMAQISRFHTAARVPRQVELDEEERLRQLELRMTLIAEEHDEVQEEIYKALNGRGDIHALAKELADLLVVIYGTAEVLEIPLESVYAEVMASNMSKTVDATWREDGKLLKGPHYEPPDVPGIFESDTKY